MDRALEAMALSANLQCSAASPPPIDILLSRWYSDQERTTSLRGMLLHSLSYLQPEHAALVSAAQRKQLYFELQPKRNDPYLVCAILKGLAQIKDHTPVYDVIVLGNGGRSAAEFPQIQAAARVYLVSLGYSL
jgi:hypothetical protein